MTPHPITIYALDGEVLKGEYSFTSRMKGSVKVARPDSSEVLTEEFTGVDEQSFSYGYSQAFGRAFGTAYGPGGTATSSATANASGYGWRVSDSGRFQGMGFIRRTTHRHAVLLHGLHAHQQRHRQVQEQQGEGIRLTVLATNINSVTATD